ncbi:hypothetical protein [Neogemmobacter tilapiae]|nr:hypothetical protein [Gemmobacter tilapiae]
MAKLWAEDGLKVSAGRKWAEGADLGFLHLNKTRIKPNEVPIIPNGGRLLNGKALDISKRVISSLLVTPESNWDGRVIIKTDLNHFGIPEAQGKKPSWKAKLRSQVAKFSWQLARELPFKDYPVLSGLRKVPPWVWEDKRLIVEKFLPEIDSGYYCVRGWMFLGQQSYGWKLYSTHPLAKGGTMVKHDYLEDIPEGLEALRAMHGFDFGKFDYVMHEGRAVLLDANKTPAFVGDPASPRLRRLASGIHDYL